MKASLLRLPRLFGPQVSIAARERRDALVLLAAVALVVAPHFEHLSIWASLTLTGLLVWRSVLTLAQRPLPGRIVMMPLLVAAAVAVWLQYGTLIGREAGVTFLLLLMALKLLEMRARRDVFVVIFLAFFILLTQFMYSQALPIAALALVAVLLLFYVLVGVNLDEQDLPTRRKARLVGLVFLKALPLALAMFVLFPRLTGPLWGAPLDDAASRTGLSNSMRPGSISQLVESQEIAFRADFDGAPPPPDLLYWRGPVFGTFDGRTWSPLARRLAPPREPRVEADRRTALDYTVTLEPHQQTWLFALEMPAAAPDGPDLQPRFGPDMQLNNALPVFARTRYTLTSFPNFRFGLDATPLELRDWVGLPPGYNPRTMQLAEDLLRATVPAGAADPGRYDGALLNAVMRHLRTGGYAYTLEPPPLGRHSVDELLFDTRSGFCEHYAAAFVVLMRALDVPARVVTGYQGGEVNPVNGVLTVRQSDAHAWAEVWLRERGWVRVDPTAVVAPARTAASGRAARPGAATTLFGAADTSWLRPLRWNWEAVQNGWNQWVLSYSQQRQRSLVAQLGLDGDLQGVVLAFAVAVVVLLGALAWLSLRHKAVHDPLARAYRRLRERLVRAGVDAPAWRGPRDLAAQCDARLAPADAATARTLLHDYEALRYASGTPGRARGFDWRRRARAFRPRRVTA